MWHVCSHFVCCMHDLLRRTRKACRFGVQRLGKGCMQSVRCARCMVLQRLSVLITMMLAHQRLAIAGPGADSGVVGASADAGGATGSGPSVHTALAAGWASLSSRLFAVVVDAAMRLNGTDHSVPPDSETRTRHRLG
jgi:hypothetical protein